MVTTLGLHNRRKKVRLAEQLLYSRQTGLGSELKVEELHRQVINDGDLKNKTDNVRTT
jgi:hypothetical protein